MFLGHDAVAFASKRFAPETSLGTLLAAVTFLDLLWPVFLVTGVEHVRIDPGNTPWTPLDFYDYPISHSLLTAVGWSLLFGGVYYGVRRYRAGALLVGFGVLSHWILDWFTHRADLPLYPGGPLAGLGLWYSRPATLTIESLMFAAALAIYLRCTAARDRTGTIALVSLIALLCIVYLSSAFGPPPPSAKAVAWGAMSCWLIPLWGYWIDRHRKART